MAFGKISVRAPIINVRKLSTCIKLAAVTLSVYGVGATTAAAGHPPRKYKK